MRCIKRGMSCFLMVMVGILLGMASARAEAPDLNVTAPEVAPIVDAPSTNAVSPAVTNAPPAVTNVPRTVTNDTPVVSVGTNDLANPVVTNVPAEVAAVLDAPAAWKATSWQVGTRISEFKLQNKTRGTSGNGSFFGTITTITEEQDHAPNKFFLQYRLVKSPVWIGVSYDHIRAITMEDSRDITRGDGTEDLQAFVPYLHAAWDNKTRFTPFAQVGYAFYKAKFEPNAWGDDRRRYVEQESSVNGFELVGGLSVRLYKNVSADIFAKYAEVPDITGEWYYNYGRNDGGPFVMTMSYTAYGAGLNWRF